MILLLTNIMMLGWIIAQARHQGIMREVYLGKCLTEIDKAKSELLLYK